MIVLDATLVIATIGANDPHSDEAIAILETATDLGIHPVTLGESLVHSVRRGHELTTLADLRDAGITEVAMGPDQPLVLARLRARTRLKMPDCCVLAAALQTGATVATFDQRLADAARDLGLTAVGA